MIIGVTGTSGSGKSTVSEMLKEKLNCKSVNADQVAKDMAKKGNNYYDEIVAYFGEEILDEEREINRIKLAQIVYSDKEKREKLNDMTNAHVADEIKKEAFRLVREGMVILDVPRLIESGLDRICNIIIAVLADTEIKLERICKRDQVDIETARIRLGIQPTDEFYMSCADYSIRNDDERNLETQVNIIANKIMEGN